MGFNRKILDAERFISKAKLEDLYLKQKLSDSEIGELFNISGGKVHRLRNRYNIKAIEYYKRHHKQELSDKEKAFLIGVLLGDGHIRLREEKNNLNRAYPQLMLEQSSKHREYVFWLWNEIKDWVFDLNCTPKQVRKTHKYTGKIYHSYPFQTICHPVFKEFYDAFYSGDKKAINIDFIAQYFNEYSFAIWIMDDGTKQKNSIDLCSHSFTYDENKLLLNFLYNKYQITGSVRTYNNLSHIALSAVSSRFVSCMLKDYVIPSMHYKLTSSETTNDTVKLNLPKV